MRVFAYVFQALSKQASLKYFVPVSTDFRTLRARARALVCEFVKLSLDQLVFVLFFFFLLPLLLYPVTTVYVPFGRPPLCNGHGVANC